MRYLKTLSVCMVVIGLMASGAWAGSLIVRDGTPAKIALEAMGTARNLTISVITSNNAIKLTSSRTLISGDLINFTFANFGTTTDKYYLCETGNDVVMDGVNQAANSTAFSLRANRSITTGTNMFLSTNSALVAGTGCSTAGIGEVNVKFPATSASAMASVAFNITSFGALMDSASAVNIANISKQFATNYVSGNSTIDFAANATSNGTKFTIGNTAAPGNAEIRFTGMDLNAAGATAPHAGLTVSALLSLQDSASWQGVQRVYVNNGVACSLATNVAVNNSPSGTVNLSIPTTAFNGAADFIGDVCADVKGNVVLQSRAVKAAYDISVSTGGNDPAMDTYTTVMQWMPNGYQGTIPYISALPVYLTVCMLNNKSSAGGSVTVDILTSESGTALTALSGLGLGTLAAQGTMRVDFGSSITPYTYSGGVESAGTPITLTGLQSNDRYTAMINVGASPTQITVNCIQLDPAGSKRAVPVLTQQEPTKTWTQ